MLRSTMELYGKRLGAADGDIGLVKDFYFDDQQWVVRYVIADTGSWLPGRLVLISPHAFGNFHEDGECLRVNLTRQQIESSPAIEAHKPVSRQREEEYNSYYGWPYYWVGGAFPMPYLMGGRKASSFDKPHDSEDSHLRSAKVLTGYHIQTSDGTVGRVTNFIVDDASWAICQLVVETGDWFSGEEIAISPDYIDYISSLESKVFVNVTKEAILEAPKYEGPPLNTEYHEMQKLD